MGNTLSAAWLQEQIGHVASDITPAYLRSKRWFGSKSRSILGSRAVDFDLLPVEPDLFGLLLLEISYAEAAPELYLLPLVFRPEEQVPAEVKRQPESAAATVRTPQGVVWAYDAFAEDPFCALLYGSMYDDTEVQTGEGKLLFRHIPDRMDSRHVRTMRRISTEQSNTSLVFNDALILKVFRKLSIGRNPDFEVPYFLTTHTDFAYVPKVAGFIEYQTARGEPISVGVLQDFVVNQGDGYTLALNRVRDYFPRVLQSIEERPGDTPQERADRVREYAGTMPEAVRRLGAITGLMHVALASDTDDPAFRPEQIGHQDTEGWERAICTLIEQVIRTVRDRLPGLPADQQALLRPVADQEQAFLEMIGGLHVLAEEGCHRTRYHGDYHLGQVLRTGDDFIILDFEGEPARSLAERRAKHCPLKDVAGMLRSFDYAAFAGLFELWQERQPDEAEKAELERWAVAWEDLAHRAFLAGYCDATAGHTGPRFLPPDPAAFQEVVRIFELEKAFYELNYEFNNRPTWIPIPASGLLRILRDGDEGVR